MKPYIFITRKLPNDIVDQLSLRYEVSMWGYEDIAVPKERLLQEAAKANALLTMLSEQVSEEVLSAGPNLKVVANMAVGYDNVDVNTAAKKGIAVCNTPDVLTDSTADLTFGLMLAAGRRMVESSEYIKQNKWQSWSPMLLAGQDIHHKTLGIFGMGKIGEAVAQRAKGFNMKVIYHNRTRKTEQEQRLGAKFCSFTELIQSADFVVCLAPLTDETRKAFTYEIFKQMKNTAVFINASRGGLVDEQGLLTALQTGEITAAGLDVFEREPISADHPLLKLPNVVALPHIGSSSRETRMAMMQLCVDNIIAVLSGEKPPALVNQDWKPKN
ncbi:2-hydroxyacid dehydrogenase [Mesobacillus harenae]|uniref:2-hydroxyacid dehydrogenase n=1 Tax=Mesobacillus harenae TaxID=2213203 RepID=UPI00158110FA|nr:D-glycerate dehydrogenase [Mesobacillus harenae]